MHPAGQQPVFLDGLGREEPVAPLGAPGGKVATAGQTTRLPHRSEEHTSELQSLMRISYAVFCLKKKKKKIKKKKTELKQTKRMKQTKEDKLAKKYWNKRTNRHTTNNDNN